MRKADYTYITKWSAGHNILLIEDLNLGNTSVTNDIENVVAEIATLEKINPENFIIIYKDSEGVWDGWDHEKQQFIPLSEDNSNDAIDKYLLKQLASAIKSSAVKI